jgi:hypothetical protein
MKTTQKCGPKKTHSTTQYCLSLDPKTQQEPNPGIPSPNIIKNFSKFQESYKSMRLGFFFFFLGPFFFIGKKGVLYANCRIPEIK